MTTTVQKNSENLHNLCMFFSRKLQKSQNAYFCVMLDEVYVYAGLKCLIYYA